MREPGLWSSSWRCAQHGDIDPFHRAAGLGSESLQHLVEHAQVPVWLPWPLPQGWLLTGMAHAGDERTGARASAVALTGPSELGGPAELVLVAEHAGVGLGASYAGVDSTDPTPLLGGSAELKLHAAGHPTALWSTMSAPDRAAFVGEACGVWLWTVVWPASCALTLLDALHLHDLREHETPVETGIPFGAPSPWI